MNAFGEEVLISSSDLISTVSLILWGSEEQELMELFIIPDKEINDSDRNLMLKYHNKLALDKNFDPDDDPAYQKLISYLEDPEKYIIRVNWIRMLANGLSIQKI